MEKLFIPADIYNEMLIYCKDHLPDEACGILAGLGEQVTAIHKMTNSDSSPTSYMMDPAEQFIAMKEIRKNGLQIVALFHSHPVSEPKPSQKDRELAFYDDSAYLIVGLESGCPDVKAYMIKEGDVAEISIEIV